jgi:hypothetical protein
MALANIKPTVGKKELEECERFTTLFGSFEEAKGGKNKEGDKGKPEGRVVEAKKRTGEEQEGQRPAKKQRRGDV